MLPGELDGKRVLRALGRLGWKTISVRGSHRKMAGPDGSRIIVAFHGKMSRYSVLRALKQARISEAEFEKAYR